ncbi:glycosyltransferase family 4 protein [Prolixibacteraceae bacterium Z1-6]|uniref:Glycosyltransferase family 4 protein n=1 Tax=Draconibacterium aestuarii TaxID=2998507 RepID=A0A9X3F9Y7_9BACT|nr:glycosyltransferase family 4 protein [Prolixibacteraceae bacterium Z1-6]
MKVLWITNTPFPEVYSELKIQASVTVGYVSSAAQSLFYQGNNIKLAVASCSFVNKFTQINKNGITHFIIPYKIGENLNHRKNAIFWQRIKNEFQPDIIHIHGTEYSHSYAFVKACGPENVLVSIQGLVSAITRYYFADIKLSEIIKSITLRDIVRLDTMFHHYREMSKRSASEISLIKEIDHISGRTSWDRDHSLAINPNINYHFCNESLRQSFYERQWSINRCRRNSIFLSQAYYPIKGFHKFIKALPMVLKYFPDTKVYVAGNNFFTNRGLKINGYGKYINTLIGKLKLTGYIHFLGLLTEETMCQQYIDSHLFISSSAIENSPNSVGEAQILGVPCIASYAGGTPDMIEHGKDGLLYRFEEIEMLASHICKVFSDDQLAQELSKNGRISAGERHNRAKNGKQLYQIYSNIVGINNSLIAENTYPVSEKKTVPAIL